MCFMITAMLFASGSSTANKSSSLDLLKRFVGELLQFSQLQNRVVDEMLFDHIVLGVTWPVR